MPPHKLLVVDDEQDIREMLRLVLEGEGYTVLTAKNGLEALALLLTHNSFSLILCDLRMGGMDGWTFAAAYRSDPAHIAHGLAPIIAITAAATAQEWAAQIGAVAYLAKPFSLADVRAVVKAFLAPLP